MKELTLQATVENIPPATDYLNENLLAWGCPGKVMNQMDIALDEIFSNIAKYAYPAGNGMVTISVSQEEELEEKILCVIFQDSGVPFDPLAESDPDTRASLSEREPGGLGLFLVKTWMDEMFYRREDGKNILTIRKRFAPM